MWFISISLLPVGRIQFESNWICLMDWSNAATLNECKFCQCPPHLPLILNEPISDYLCHQLVWSRDLHFYFRSLPVMTHVTGSWWSTDGQPVRRRIVAFTQLGFVWFYWLMAPIRAAVSMGDSHWRDSFVTNARGDSPQRRTRETMVEKRDAFEAFLQWRIAVWTLCISPAPFFHVCKSVWEIGGTPDVASLLPLFFFIFI